MKKLKDAIKKNQKLYTVLKRIKDGIINITYHFLLLKREIIWFKPLIKSKNNNNKIIISLTSFPARIKTVHKTVNTLINQKKKADFVVLWLAKNQFKNLEGDLPEQLLQLKKYGLIIKWVDNDIGPYKKLVPTMMNYADYIIVTADDDVYYPINWLESLYNSYVNNPKAISCHLVTEVTYDGKFTFVNTYGKNGTGKHSANYKILGCGGVLYPPNCLHKDYCNEDLFMSLAPTNDDVWFWAMALLNKTHIIWIDNNMKKLCYVEETQDNNCLFKINNYGENLREKQTNNVFSYYSLFKEL